MRTALHLLLLLATTGLLGACNDSQPHDEPVAAASEPRAETSKKRRAPPRAEPIVVDGVRYDAPLWGKTLGLGQNGGHLRATDATTGEELWILVVYEIAYDGDKEDDKFDRFITRIRDIGRGQLRIDSEGCGAYRVDTESRKVTVLREPPC